MTAGRRPNPTALNLLLGNPGHRPINEAEPEVDEPIPAPPPHIKGPALEEWNRVVPALRRARIVTALDWSTVAAYCLAFGRWVQAEAELEAGGPVIKTEKANYPILNPWLSVANKAMEQANRFAIELGMTPSARSRVKVTGKAKKKNAFMNLTGGRRGSAAA